MRDEALDALRKRMDVAYRATLPRATLVTSAERCGRADRRVMYCTDAHGFAAGPWAVLADGRYLDLRRAPHLCAVRARAVSGAPRVCIVLAVAVHHLWRRVGGVCRG
jgi:hypothetical protein